MSFYPLKILSNSSLSPDFCHQLFRTISLTRILASHYDTLKLKRDCTPKEIREAFLDLSKQLHPDKTNNPNTHARFVKLNEAYSVLSKPHSRTDYDLSLSTPSSGITSSRDKQEWVYRNSSFKNDWEYERSRDKFYKNQSYYGIAGIKKLPNSWIVIFCIFFTLVGVGLQAIAISSSVTFERDKLDEYSAKNSLMHSAVRQQAKENGNEVQLELLRRRLNEAEIASHAKHDNQKLVEL